MSHPKLFIRPPPHKTFVQGYPSIPPSPRIDRPPPHLSGTVEVRLGQKPIHAAYLNIELIKIETIPSSKFLNASNAINRFEEIINKKPLVLWASSSDSSPPGSNGNHESTISKSKHRKSALSLSTMAKSKHKKDRSITGAAITSPLKDVFGLEPPSNNGDVQENSTSLTLNQSSDRSETRQPSGILAWAPLAAGDFAFDIPLPLNLPPSLTIDHKTGTGISYTLRATLCSRPKNPASPTGSSWFRRTSAPILVTTSTNIDIVRHDLHSTWPIYRPLPSEVSVATDRGLSMEVVRRKIAIGPGDEINSRIKLESSSIYPIKVNRFEINLTEIITYHPNGKLLSPSLDLTKTMTSDLNDSTKLLKKSSSSKKIEASESKISTVVNVHAKVQQTLEYQNSLSFDVRGLFPETHNRVTINSAEHVSIHYLMRVRAVLESSTGKNSDKKRLPTELIVSDLPLTIGDRDHARSKATMEEIGTVTTLCHPTLISSKNGSPPQRSIRPSTTDPGDARNFLPHRSSRQFTPSPQPSPIHQNRDQRPTITPSLLANAQESSATPPPDRHLINASPLKPPPNRNSILTTNKNGPRPYLQPSNPRHSITHDTALLGLAGPSRLPTRYTFGRGDTDGEGEGDVDREPEHFEGTSRGTRGYRTNATRNGNPVMGKSKSHISLRSVSQPTPNRSLTPPPAPSTLPWPISIQTSGLQERGNEKELFSRAKQTAARVQSLIRSPVTDQSFSSDGSMIIGSNSLGPFPRHSNVASTSNSNNGSNSSNSSYVNAEEEKRALESSLRSPVRVNVAPLGTSTPLSQDLQEEDIKSAITQSTILPVYGASSSGGSISPTLSHRLPDLFLGLGSFGDGSGLLELPQPLRRSPPPHSPRSPHHPTSPRLPNEHSLADTTRSVEESANSSSMFHGSVAQSIGTSSGFSNGQSHRGLDVNIPTSPNSITNRSDSPPPPPVNFKTRPSLRPALPVPPTRIDPQKEAYLKAVAQRDAHFSGSTSSAVLTALEEKNRLKAAWEQVEKSGMSHHDVFSPSGSSSSTSSSGASRHIGTSMMLGPSSNGMIGFRNLKDQHLVEEELLRMPTANRAHAPQGNWFA